MPNLFLIKLGTLINEFKEWDGSDLGFEWRLDQEVFDLDTPAWVKKHNESILYSNWKNIRG